MQIGFFYVTQKFEFNLENLAQTVSMKNFRKICALVFLLIISLLVVTNPPVKKGSATIEKRVFLTFDDGPSTIVTKRILDILDFYKVKASFFVLGKMAETRPDTIKKINEGGHTIGIHGYSHNYKTIFSSQDALIKDIAKCVEVIKNILPNYTPTAYRFPGGSYNLSNEIKKAPSLLGLNYYDWDTLIGDAEYNDGRVTTLLSRFKSTLKDKNEIIVLMHDSPTKNTTYYALPMIIEYFQDNGYNFYKL